LADEPWWLDATPEAYRKARWEQKVMAWLYRTQPDWRSEALAIGYMAREPRAIAAFERASALMREEERQNGTINFNRRYRGNASDGEDGLPRLGRLRRSAREPWARRN
jgi:hypothetical protein